MSEEAETLPKSVTTYLIYYNRTISLDPKRLNEGSALVVDTVIAVRQTSAPSWAAR